VEPEIREARLSASRSEAVLDIPDMAAVPVAENIACLLRHIREDSIEEFVLLRVYLKAPISLKRESNEKGAAMGFIKYITIVKMHCFFTIVM
jgi:hypothetical protein